MATPSLLIIPDRYKAAKLYSQIPDSGAGDFVVTRSTTATRVNASGLLESVASGVPRLDYTGGGCPSLLVEPAATNLILYSEEIDNDAWSKTGITITANEVISPDGTQNADKLENLSDGSRYVAQSILLTSGTSYTYSAFFKKGIMDWCYMLAVASTNISASTFDILNGVVGLTSSSTITTTNKIEDYGNGWYRCSITFTAPTTASYAFRLYNADSSTDVNTVAGSYSYIYGAQLEAGSVATSYIPTVASTVTRNADVISLSSVSGLIGQTEGTLYAEVDVSQLLGATARIIIIIGTSTNLVRIQFTGTASNTLRALVRESNATKYEATFPYATTGTLKVAIGYKSADSVFYVNGTQVASSSNLSFTFPTIEDLEIGGSSQFNDRISAAAIYTSRLSDSELQSLTTL